MTSEREVLVHAGAAGRNDWTVSGLSLLRETRRAGAVQLAAAAIAVVLVVGATGCGHADGVDGRAAVDSRGGNAVVQPDAPASAGETTPRRAETPERLSILGELTGLGGRHDETVAGVFTIDSQADWDGMWHAHGRAPVPLPADLDLEHHTALVVFLGSRSTGGYSVRIESVLTTSSEVVVVYRETVPGRGCMVTTAFTYPRHGVVVGKIVQSIRFVGEKTTKDCQASP